jgi:hypothetical protein
LNQIRASPPVAARRASARPFHRWTRRSVFHPTSDMDASAVERLSQLRQTNLAPNCRCADLGQQALPWRFARGPQPLRNGGSPCSPWCRRCGQSTARRFGGLRTTSAYSSNAEGDGMDRGMTPVPPREITARSARKGT